MAEQKGKAAGTKQNICVCDRTRALGRRPPRRKKQRYCIYNISIVSLQYLRNAKDYSRRRKVYCTKNRDTKIYKGKRPKRSRGRRRRFLKGSHFLEVQAPLPAVSRPGPCWGLTDPSLARCYRRGTMVALALPRSQKTLCTLVQH